MDKNMQLAKVNHDIPKPRVMSLAKGTELMFTEFVDHQNLSPEAMHEKMKLVNSLIGEESILEPVQISNTVRLTKVMTRETEEQNQLQILCTFEAIT